MEVYYSTSGERCAVVCEGAGLRDAFVGARMSETVAQMTKDELQELIESSLETKLRELLGDPDEGLELKKVVRDRLLRQKKAVAAGERGEPLSDVVRRLGLA